MTVDSHCDITEGSVATSRLDRCMWSTLRWQVLLRSVGTVPPFFDTAFFESPSNYDTVRSVMKADPSALTRPRAGAPPRPTHRRCHIGGHGGSACRNRIFESDHGCRRRTGRHHQDGVVPPLVQQGRTRPRGGVPVAPTALQAPEGDIAADVRAMIDAARDVFTAPVVRAALPGLMADMTADAELNARVMTRFTELFTMVRMRLREAVGRGEAHPGVDPDRLIELIGERRCCGCCCAQATRWMTRGWIRPRPSSCTGCSRDDPSSDLRDGPRSSPAPAAALAGRSRWRSRRKARR